MAFDSQTTTPPSSITGILRLGLSFAYSGVSSRPKAPPASIRWCGSSSSAIVHITFCTLIEFGLPQTRIMLLPRKAPAAVPPPPVRRPRDPSSLLPMAAGLTIT